MTVLMGLPLIVLSDVTNRHTILCNNDTGQLNKEHQQCLKSSQAQQVSMTMCLVLFDNHLTKSYIQWPDVGLRLLCWHNFEVANFVRIIPEL